MPRLAPRAVLYLAGKLAAGAIDIVAARLARRRDQTGPHQYIAKRGDAFGRRALEPGIRKRVEGNQIEFAGHALYQRHQLLCLLVNDSVEQAKQLVTLVKGVSCKFNLIPFNAFADSGFERSSTERIGAFRDVLMQAGLVTTTRKTRGDDIDGACGQLAGRVQDRTQRKARRTAAASI